MFYSHVCFSRHPHVQRRTREQIARMNAPDGFDSLAEYYASLRNPDSAFPEDITEQQADARAAHVLESDEVAKVLSTPGALYYVYVASAKTVADEHTKSITNGNGDEKKGVLRWADGKRTYPDEITEENGWRHKIVYTSKSPFNADAIELAVTERALATTRAHALNGAIATGTVVPKRGALDLFIQGLHDKGEHLDIPLFGEGGLANKNTDGALGKRWRQVVEMIHQTYSVGIVYRLEGLGTCYSLRPDHKAAERYAERTSASSSSAPPTHAARKHKRGSLGRSRPPSVAASSSSRPTAPSSSSARKKRKKRAVIVLDSSDDDE